MGGGSELSGHPPPPQSPSSSSESVQSEPLDVRQSDEAFRRCTTYLEILQSYEQRPEGRARDLQEAKDAIRRHKPGDWIEEVGGLKRDDYEVPEAIALLLVGPRGSGKSSLVNRITRVFDDDPFAPDRAQVSHNLSVTDGSCFLQEYMVPRNSKSLCVYDTRSFSPITDDNKKLLEAWMTQGVSHGEMVIRASDGIAEKKRIKAMARQGYISPCQKKIVNFVIFVVDGVSILKSMNGKDTQYTDVLIQTFNYPFLSFTDNKPIVVITHGDELAPYERAHVRTHLGEKLGIPPCKQIFDIPDTSDYDTELAIVDMLRYSIEHADRNLPYKHKSFLEVSMDNFVCFQSLILTVEVIILIILLARVITMLMAW